jgi:hypothetical protein
MHECKNPSVLNLGRHLNPVFHISLSISSLGRTNTVSRWQKPITLSRKTIILLNIAHLHENINVSAVNKLFNCFILQTLRKLTINPNFLTKYFIQPISLSVLEVSNGYTLSNMNFLYISFYT